MGIFNQFLRNSYKGTEFLVSFNNIAVPLALCLGTASRGLVLERVRSGLRERPPSVISGGDAIPSGEVG